MEKNNLQKKVEGLEKQVREVIKKVQKKLTIVLKYAQTCANKITQNLHKNVFKENIHKCVQRKAQKWVQENAPKCVQKNSPKCVKKMHQNVLKNEPKCVKKFSMDNNPDHRSMVVKKTGENDNNCVCDVISHKKKKLPPALIKM